jgi:hypothetical protein
MKNEKTNKLSFTRATVMNLRVKTNIETGLNGYPSVDYACRATQPITCNSNGCGTGTSSQHQGKTTCAIQ